MTTAASNLTLDIWYGREQRFGHLGNPQRFANVLGRVSPVEYLRMLTFSLNGGPEVPLSIGPDSKRLQSPGDFNIDVDTGALVPDVNHVIITATNLNGKTQSEVVTLHYLPGQVWPLPYEIDWHVCDSISEVAQVVDGWWVIGDAGVRTVEPGYDRLIAIGDVSWKHYDVSVECTIHRFGPPDQWGPGVGVLLHWQGHYDWQDGQPRSGWWPLGALGWYLHLGQWGEFRLNFFGNRGEVLAADTRGKRLLTGIQYILRLRAEAGSGASTTYRMKVWPADEPESNTWDVCASGPADELPLGSLLLLAHHTEVSFGKVSVRPVD